MADPFLGEIKIFAGNFAPRGWAFCSGQLLQINQFDALFSLLGTQYGGDGRTTFGLPDMRGRVPIHQGQGPGLSNRRIGSRFGSESETLTTNHLPSHNHSFLASTNDATAGYPAGKVAADTPNDNVYLAPTSTTPEPDVVLPANTLDNSGGGQSHTNVMPFVCVHFIIALVGIYPSRS